MTAPTVPMASRLQSRDVPIALVIAGLVEIGSRVTLTDDVDQQLDTPDVGGRLLLLIAAASLAARHVVPWPVLLLTVALSLVDQGLGHRPAPLPLAVIVALFTVTVFVRPVVGAATAGVYAAAVIVGSATSLTQIDDDQVYVYLVAVAGTVTVGYGVALARARAGLAEQRALELVRRQDARIRLARAQEQARIAREVHDIVAHNVSVMVAQAAAVRCSPSQGADATGWQDRAGSALASIEAVGRDALASLRRLMDLLRSSPELTDGPPPDLERIGWLLEHVRRAGLPVDLVVHGAPVAMPAEVELDAYRIVQESLTNILKHAGPTRATVVLTYAGDSLDVEVVNGNGRGPGDSGSGRGISGMRERVASIGGELVARPEGDSGFRVAARLPIGGAAQ